MSSPATKPAAGKQPVDVDVVIAGGGLVGASLACALASANIKVAVVEAFAFESSEQPSFDEKMVALTWSSRQIFEGIGVWQDIKAVDASPIHSIHVSDRGHFGMTRLSISDLKGDAGADALGYVVPTRVIGRALGARLSDASNITMFCPDRVVSANPSADGIVVHTEHQALRARLLVVADGGRSNIASQFGMRSRGRDYRQKALVTVVSTDQPHRQQAYERFTKSGPLALLPATDDRYAVAWTLEPREADRLAACANDEFIEALGQCFGQRAGRFTDVGQRQLYPLSIKTLTTPIGDRAVAIGNAAHTVHPVAGQGFNLGLRDVANLAESIWRAAVDGSDPGSMARLEQYARDRRRDTRNVNLLTDGLIRGFTQDFLPLAGLRNGGLSLINLLPPIKRSLLRQTMGLNSAKSRLALGLPLTSDVIPTRSRDEQ